MFGNGFSAIISLFFVVVEKNTIFGISELFYNYVEQEAQLMLTTGSTRLAVSRGQ